MEQISPVELPPYYWWLPNPQASDYGTPSVFKYETNLDHYQLVSLDDSDAILVEYDPLKKTISLQAKTSIGKEGKVGGKASIKLSDSSGNTLIRTFTPGFFATREHTLNTLKLRSISEDLALQFYDRMGLDLSIAINAESGLASPFLKAEYALGMKLPFYLRAGRLSLDLEAGLRSQLSTIDNYSTPIDAAWKANLSYTSLPTAITLSGTVVNPIGDSSADAKLTFGAILQLKRWKLNGVNLMWKLGIEYKGSIGKMETKPELETSFFIEF